MLNKGFKEQIYDIYRYLPPETQASAAAPRACREREATGNGCSEPPHRTTHARVWATLRGGRRVTQRPPAGRAPREPAHVLLPPATTRLPPRAR